MINTKMASNHKTKPLKETKKDREEKAKALMKKKPEDKKDEVRELVEGLIKEAEAAEEEFEEEEGLKGKVEAKGSGSAIRQHSADELEEFISTIPTRAPIGAQTAATLEGTVGISPRRISEDDEDEKVSYKKGKDYTAERKPTEAYIPKVEDSRVNYLMHHDGIKRIEAPTNIPLKDQMPEYMQKAMQKEVYDSIELDKLEEQDMAAHARESGEHKFYVSGTKEKTKKLK